MILVRKTTGLASLVRGNAGDNRLLGCEPSHQWAGSILWGVSLTEDLSRRRGLGPSLTLTKPESNI